MPEHHYQVVVLAPAVEQIQQIDTWWRQQRPAAPNLFARELERTLEQLASHPELGHPFPARIHSPVHRTALSASRYFVYYSIETLLDRVVVRAVWHMSRKRGPRLK